MMPHLYIQKANLFNVYLAKDIPSAKTICGDAVSSTEHKEPDSG